MPTFATPEPISVAITLIAGDARVIASDRTDTVVVVSPSDPSNAADLRAAEQTRVEFAQGRLLVKAPNQWRHYSPFGTGGSITVVVELPSDSDVQGHAAMGDFRGEGRLGACSVRTTAGHISLEHSGPLQATTTAGDVTVDRAAGDTEVTASGDVRIRTIAGTAVVRNLNGDNWIGEVIGDLRCNTANGDIAVDRAHAAVTATTANGSILVGEAMRGSVAIETASGDLEVGIREGTAALLDLRTRYGSVRNALEPADRPGPSEETVEVRARTSSGDIVIRRSLGAAPQHPGGPNDRH